MTKRKQIYRCQVCGNIVEVLNPGAGTLVCCGQPMNLLDENTTDAAQEKHVPVVTRTENGFRVEVGSVAHPMEEKHYVQWIELVTPARTYRKYLNPGEAPVAEFCVGAEEASGEVYAREYCNLHGLWKA